MLYIPMDHFQNLQPQKHSNKHKKRLSQDQVRLLEANFNFTNKLDQERKSRLALELNIPPRQVAIWYQNRRARDKTQIIELDRHALQIKLENVLEDNARLKDETERLRTELGKVHGVLSSNFNSSSSCESGMIQKHNLEGEFYGSMIGGGGGQFVASDGYNLFGRSIS